MMDELLQAAEILRVKAEEMGGEVKALVIDNKRLAPSIQISVGFGEEDLQKYISELPRLETIVLTEMVQEARKNNRKEIAGGFIFKMEGDERAGTC